MRKIIFLIVILAVVFFFANDTCDDVWGWENTACIAFGGYVWDLNIGQYPYVPFQTMLMQRYQNTNGLYNIRMVFQYHINDGWEFETQPFESEYVGVNGGH